MGTKLTNREMDLWSKMLERGVAYVEIKEGLNNKILALCYDGAGSFVTCYPAKSTEKFLKKLVNNGGAREECGARYIIVR
jgi:hypothetical protein